MAMILCMYMLRMKSNILSGIHQAWLNLIHVICCDNNQHSIPFKMLDVKSVNKDWDKLHFIIVLLNFK